MVKTGTKLGPYEILSPLGKGGMGEVFRARDSKLDRDVAIKVLPEFYSRDPERLARFQREAKVLASLDHPNIASVYGFDESDGTRFLALEFVGGETLGQRLKSGPMPVEEALETSKQIADALEAAHGQGIIHRDLKPANVMIRPDGVVKVLDFGLAKAMTEESSTSEEANSPTITANFTRPGVVLGTAAYMSPEQARGRPLDKRSDIWSFGIILFECLTGSRLFGGETANDSMGAIMHKDPDWSLLPPGTPPTIQLLLRRCLTKDRKRRLHDIADARIELENALVDPASTSLGLAQAALDAKRRWLPAWPAVLGFAVLLALISFGVWYAKPERPRQLWNLTLSVPEDQGYRISTWSQGVAVSPDGRQAAFIIRDENVSERENRILLRQLDLSEGIILANTEGARHATFSPDGNWIAFISGPNSLLKISTRGGPTSTLYRSEGFLYDAVWGVDGTIVFAELNRKEESTGLRRISGNGGTPEALTNLDRDSEVVHMHPQFLADGSGVTFSVGGWNKRWDDFAIAALRFGDTEPKEILRGGSGAQSLSTGHLVYRREQTLMAAPFDLARLETTAPAVPILEGIGSERAMQFSRLAISRHGTLIYLPFTGESVTERELTWLELDGTMSRASDELRNYDSPRLSPDGSHIVVRLRLNNKGGEEEGLYLLERQRDLLRQLNSASDLAGDPVWSPDGKWVVFAAREVGGKANLYKIAGDFGGSAERLTTSDVSQFPCDISPDGRFLAVDSEAPDSKEELILLPLDEQSRIDGDPVRILEAKEWLGESRFSPDGKWIAFVLGDSGRAEVYVKPTSGTGAAVQVSTEGGQLPRWSPVESTLYFSTNFHPFNLHSTSFTVEEGRFRPELPVRVFDLDDEQRARFLEISPDGKRFLTTTWPNAEPDVWANPKIVLNWFEDLKAKVPIN